MATFLVLTRFTDQGSRNVKDTVARADAYKQMANKLGITVKGLYWTLGAYDVIALCEAPDDETMTALSLSGGALGGVHTQTLRAFSADEMQAILGKMA
jgi:uncharacterized protein with GYD domain